MLLAAMHVAACSSSDIASSNDAGSPNWSGGASGDGGTTGTGGAATGGGGPLPPEEELEGEYQAPVAAGRFLWAANPDSNRVALIDAESLDVVSLDGGYAPTHLAALPAHGAHSAGAAVINVRGKDATLFSLPEGDSAVTRSSIEDAKVPLYGAANAWEVGKTGAVAIAWTRAKDVNLADPTEGFQDVTIIDRRGAKLVTTRLSVGYRPNQVFIDENEQRAFVVSEPGISVIDLEADGGPVVARELFLPEQPVGAERDVSFVPNGEHAFVRLGGKSEILIVSTLSDGSVTVKLPAPVTDLDLSADGSRAVAVMRRDGTGSSSTDGSAGAAGSAGGPVEEVEAPSRIAVLPVATITEQPTNFDLYELDGLFGSAVLSRDAKRALLFTNAIESNELAIVELDSGKHRELDLKAPVKSVFLTGDGKNAVALLSPPPDSVKSGAFALVPVEKALPPRIEGTEAPTFLVALSADPARALITTKDTLGNQSAVYLASFPGLSVDRTALPSQPLAAGIVPDAGKGFVAEVHSEGRVTFVDLAGGSARTLTGFELGAKVIEGE